MINNIYIYIYIYTRPYSYVNVYQAGYTSNFSAHQPWNPVKSSRRPWPSWCMRCARTPGARSPDRSDGARVGKPCNGPKRTVTLFDLSWGSMWNWWFGTWLDYDFPIILGMENHPNLRTKICFRGVGIPPTRKVIGKHPIKPYFFG